MYDETCTEKNELIELFHAQAEFRVNIKEPGIALLKKQFLIPFLYRQKRHSFRVNTTSRALSKKHGFRIKISRIWL